MMKHDFWKVVLVLLVVVGCKQRPQKEQPLQTDKSSKTTTTQATAVKPAPNYPYRSSETKAFDLIHTKLEVDFEWEKQRMNGRAVLTMRPWFESQQQVVLDAKGFILHEISLTAPTLQPSLKYTYDNERLTIDLGRPYTRDETLSIRIHYTARPHELDSLVSEYAASDQGLYFVNPLGDTPGKPRQIWTQGESHGSPGWFPTFDTPNQRCTSEISITVADSFKTLSNGVLTRSEITASGLRTDHWVMDLPHAPYLFMMAIGNYAVVKDQWRGREVSYYVEPKYEPYARLIFGNTPEMMEFFSKKLGVDYPWPKYSQVVVRDFVSGAMENTSATTHFERLQHDARQHLDNTYEDIVSHELFHQWFGDLVTCESWANLSLNEGFATYGEYLWIEYKYSHDDATIHLFNDRHAYLRSAMRQKFPIIRYHHRDADVLFDAHSYQKGGQVLHMLRKLVGDDAFYAALRLYLTKNAYDDVEIHELRLAFEEVTGQDLNWFFDQWYLAAGHPELRITHSHSEGKYLVRVQQVQDHAVSPVFRLPLTVEFVFGAKTQQAQVWMESADTTFEFVASTRPDYAIVDPEKDLLLEIKEETHPHAGVWLQQALLANGHARRAGAMERMDIDQLSDTDFQQLLTLRKDPFWGTRQELLNAVEGAAMGSKPETLELFLDRMGDPNAQIRIAAVLSLHSNLSSLPSSLREAARETLLRGIRDSSYTVGQFSLETYFALDPQAGLAKAKEMMINPEPHFVGMISKILKESGGPEALVFIRENLYHPRSDGSAKIAMLRGMGDYLTKRPAEEREAGARLLMDVFRGNNGRWLRLTALQALMEMDATPEIRAFFEERKKIDEEPIFRTVIDRYLENN